MHDRFERERERVAFTNHLWYEFEIYFTLDPFEFIYY